MTATTSDAPISSRAVVLPAGVRRELWRDDVVHVWTIDSPGQVQHLAKAVWIDGPSELARGCGVIVTSAAVTIDPV